MSWSTRPSLPAGHIVTADEVDAILDQIELLTSPPLAILTRAAAQSISNSTITAISFDTASVDTAGGYSGGSPTRYTATRAGYYTLSGGIGYNSNATGIRTAQFGKNGATLDGSQAKITPISGVNTGVPCRAITVLLSVSDYVELIGFQNSGGSLNTSVEAENVPSLFVRWAGSA